MLPSLCVSAWHVLSDRDAFEELVDFFVRELLAQAREDVAQLADANVACAVLVKHLESADKLLRRARWLESVGPVQDVGERREIDCRISTTHVLSAGAFDARLATSACVGVWPRARSGAPSGAIGRVAKARGYEFFEVPTGWKFFGNLMDAGRLSICGEESFGTGSDHIREKDGLWAIVAWLNILAFANKEHAGTSVADVLQAHYKQYGRNFFSRYDYEEVESAGAQTMMSELRAKVTDPAFLGSTQGSFKVAEAGDFSYTDPIDHSVSKNQGLYVRMEDGSRIVFRLSGTGSAGATIRLYVEKYSSMAAEYAADVQEALRPIIDVGPRHPGPRPPPRGPGPGNRRAYRSGGSRDRHRPRTAQ